MIQYLLVKLDTVKVLAARLHGATFCAGRRDSPTFYLDLWKLVGVVVADTFLARCWLSHFLQWNTTRQLADFLWTSTAMAPMWCNTRQQLGKLSHRIKQLTWLRIIHSGDWCLHLALCTP